MGEKKETRAILTKEDLIKGFKRCGVAKGQAIFVHTSLKSLGFVAILGLLGTALAMILFYRLIQSTGSMFASMVTYLMPVVSVFWGFLVGEKIMWIHLFGFGMILSGVYLTQKKEKKVEVI